MSTNAWYRSGWAVIAASVALPPAGLVLNWLRPVGVVKKLLATVLICVWGLLWAIKLGLVYTRVDGSGMPSVTMKKPTVGPDYDALERSRAAQAKDLVEAAPTTVINPVADKAVTAPLVTKPPQSGLWTDYRGPNRDGRYTETAILTKWPDLGLRLLWHQPAGAGYASFVAVNGRAYTIEQRRKQEVVAAYDVAKGRELWTNAWDAEFRESMGGDGPRATPTYHDGRVYALGAAGELRCLDAANGSVVWRKNILEDNQATNLQWGMSASPLIVDDKVIVLPGGPSGKSVVAYDKLTGAPVWKSLDDKQAYTSPMLVTLAGKRQILVVSGSRMMGLTVENGTLLWEYPWRTEYDINSAQPILAGPSRVFISAGYGHGAALVEISEQGGKFQAATVWQNNRMKNKFSSSVLHEGHVYGLDEAILACMNVETGELKWKGGRYGYGQLLLASGHLIVTTEEGEVVLVKASPDSHQEIARFPAVSGRTWNVPAIAGGVLLVRNNTEMAGFRLAP